MDTLLITVPADQACLWSAAMHERLDRLHTDLGQARDGSDYAARLTTRIVEHETALATLTSHTHGNQRATA